MECKGTELSREKFEERKDLWRLLIVVTFVYASNSKVETKELWVALVELSSTVNGCCWMVFGAFIDVRAFEDRQFQGVYSHGGPSEYIQATDQTQVMEFSSIGGISLEQ